MGKKLLLFSASLVSYISAVSAQAGGSITSGNFSGIIPLIFQILGLEANLVNILGVLATFGLMTMFVYIFMKIIVENIDLLDEHSLMGGERNLIAILAVLFTLSGVASARSLIGLNLLGAWQLLIILTILLALLAGTALVIFGGGGAVAGVIPFSVGTGLGTAGKGMKKGVEQVGMDPEEMRLGEGAMNQLGNLSQRVGGYINTGEESMEAGEWEDAEKAFEEAIEVLEELESETGSGIKALHTDIDEAITDLNDAIEEERHEGDGLVDIEHKIKRIYLFLNFLANDEPPNILSSDKTEILDSFSDRNAREFSNGRMGTDPVVAEPGVDVKYEGGVYGLPQIQDDIQHIQHDLQIIQGDFEEETSDVKDAFKKLQESAIRGAQTRIILKRISKMLNELEEDSEEMEAIEQKRNFKKLYQATEADEEEEKSMEEALDQLNDYESELKEKVEKAWDEMESFLSFDEDEVRELKEELKYEEELEPVVETLRDAFANSNYNEISRKLDTVIDELETIDRELQQVLEEMSGEDKSLKAGLKDMVNKLRNTGGDGGFAGDLAGEMESWLGSSSVTF